MKIDERARAARARVLDEVDTLAIPRGADVVQRLETRRRSRILGSATIVVVVIVASLVAFRSSTPTQVEVVAPFQNLPAGSVIDGAWGAIPKGSAGIGATASLDALTTTSSSFIAGGTGLWRSTDGLHWASVASSSLTGEVGALAAHGDEVLAVASSAGMSSVVLRSTDDGRTWSVVAQRPDLFGQPAAAMGRPSVSSLRWSEAGFWIAAGGASDGYAGIWTSTDGTRWQPVLAPANGAGSVDIVDDGQGGLLAHFLNQAWTSTDGRAWAPIPLAVPSPYVLTVIGPGASIAVGADPAAPHTSPTVLLRSSDHGRTWTEDPTFQAEFPSAAAWGIGHDGSGWVIAGFSGGPGTQHVDAWISPDGRSWSAMPESLKQTPGGTLLLIASVTSTTAIMGGAPELDRYFVVDHRADASITTQSEACPGSVPRRLIDGQVAGADALPYIDDATTDRASVEQALLANEDELRNRYPGMTRAEAGPGFGAAWQGQNGGQHQVVEVNDYAIIVHVRSATECPTGAALYTSLGTAPPNVPLFFVFDA